MVLTKSELIKSLQNEVRLAVHLVGKVDRTKLDYRPSATQRSMIELLRYLAMMGPEVVKAATTGTFDSESWSAAEKAVASHDVDQVLAAISAQSDAFTKLLAGVSDADLRVEIEMFGQKDTRGAYLVNLALASCIAYRMQLFVYLKASGRTELNTMNLWGGVDAPMPS